MDQKLAESIESRPWSLDVGATSFGTSNAWNQLEIHVTFFFQRQKAGVCVCVSPPPKKKNSKNACPARNFQRSIFAKKKSCKDSKQNSPSFLNSVSSRPRLLNRWSWRSPNLPGFVEVFVPGVFVCIADRPVDVPPSCAGSGVSEVAKTVASLMFFLVEIKWSMTFWSNSIDVKIISIAMAGNSRKKAAMVDARPFLVK